MASIPGYCPHCNRVFDGRGGIHIEGGSTVTVTGSTMTCPHCGRPARLADGVFREERGELVLLSGPPLTADILLALRDIAQRAQRGEITPKTAVQESVNLDPVIGKLMSQFLSLGIPALAALITLIGVYLQHLSLEYQKESIEIQRDDSIASGDFYRDALLLLKEQRALLSDVSSPDHNKNSVGDHGGGGPKAEAKNEKVAAKSPSKRRAEVKKKRRAELKARRRMFSGKQHL